MGCVLRPAEDMSAWGVGQKIGLERQVSRRAGGVSLYVKDIPVGRGIFHERLRLGCPISNKN